MRNFAFLAAGAAMCSMSHHLAATASQTRNERTHKHLGDDLGSVHILQASSGGDSGGAGGNDGFTDVAQVQMTRHAGRHNAMTSINSGGGFTGAGSGDTPTGHVTDTLGADITAAEPSTWAGTDEQGQSTRLVI